MKRYMLLFAVLCISCACTSKSTIQALNMSRQTVMDQTESNERVIDLLQNYVFLDYAHRMQGLSGDEWQAEYSELQRQIRAVSDLRNRNTLIQCRYIGTVDQYIAGKVGWYDQAKILYGRDLTGIVETPPPKSLTDEK